MDRINTEYNLTCHGCLSKDRRMVPLGENYEIFISLIGNRKGNQITQGTDDVKFCWECSAMLKKLRMFQTQLRRAQDVLVKFLYGLETLPRSLSKLTTNTKKCYDHIVEQESTRKKSKNKPSNTDNRKKDCINKSIYIEWDDIKIEQITETTDIIYPDEVPDVNEHDDNKPLIMFTNKVKSESIKNYGIKADIKYADEVIPNVDENDDGDDNKADICSDSIKSDMDNLANGIDRDDETNLICDIKLEPGKMKRKKHKKLKKKPTEKYNWRKRNKEFATLVQTKEVDWGDYETYFTTVYFDENEMEKYIMGKERPYLDLKRYRFSCAECKLGYRNPLDFKRHKNLNHQNPNGPYKCIYCHTVLTSQLELQNHWREHTPIAKCTLCNHVLRKRGMRQHLNSAHTKQYACGKCRLTFETITKYGEHFRNAHTTYTCDYCHKDFKHRARISYHISNMHVPTSCADCNRPFLNRNKYLKHCILMHPHKVNRTEAQEAAFCVECNKQYNSIQQYQKHLKISPKHSEIKRQDTPCPECGKIFTRRNYMNNHYNLYHLKKTNFYCELCDKYFARGFGLRVHNTYVHQKTPKVRDKICDLCGRAFNNNRTMLNHRRTHTGERPHKCPYCTAEFIQKYAMQTHMRSQHKQFS